MADTTIRFNSPKVVANGSLEDNHIYLVYCKDYSVNSGEFFFMFATFTDITINNQRVGVNLTNGTYMYSGMASISYSNGTLSFSEQKMQGSGSFGVTNWNLSILKIYQIF